MIESRIIFLNQSVGPLFAELVSAIIPLFRFGGVIYTAADSKIILEKYALHNLVIKVAPSYLRSTYLKRIFSWMCYAIYVSIVIFRVKKEDFVFITSNPPLLPLFLTIILRLRGIKYSTLTYDIYPDILVHRKFIRSGGVIHSIWRKCTEVYLRHSLFNVTLSIEMANTLCSSFKLPRHDVHVVEPWADTTEIFPVQSCDNPFVPMWDLENKFVVLYSGNFGITHDIKSLLEAATLLRGHCDVEFIFVGDGIRRGEIVSHIESGISSNVRLHPFQDAKSLRYTLSLASLAVVSVDDQFDNLLVPSKVFSYIAAGAPLLAICGPESPLRRFVLDSHIGYVVSANSAREIADVIISARKQEIRLRNYAKNARQLALSDYSLVRATSKLHLLITESFSQCN